MDAEDEVAEEANEQGFTDELAACLGTLLSTAVELSEAAQDGADESPLARIRFASPAGPVHLVVPDTLALTWSCLKLGEDKEQIPERLEAGFEDETLEALSSLMKEAASALGGLLEREFGVALDAGAEPEVEVPWSAEELDGRAIRYLCVVEGLPESWIRLVVPNPVEAALRAIALIESKERRTDFAELASGLECPVVPVDVEDFAIEALRNAVGIVVAWDLGRRSGLDLIEELAQDERTRAIPVALAAPQVTQTQLLAALRAGARSFVSVPWDAEEFRTRLDLGVTPEEEAEEAPQEEAPDTEDGDA